MTNTSTPRPWDGYGCHDCKATGELFGAICKSCSGTGNHNPRPSDPSDPSDPSSTVAAASLSGAALLRDFVESYKSGAQGCDMDCDTAQALAEAIDALSAPAAVGEPDIDANNAEADRQIATDVLNWLKARGLYDPRDYQIEGPDVADLLTEHEENVRTTPTTTVTVDELARVIDPDAFDPIDNPIRNRLDYNVDRTDSALKLARALLAAFDIRGK